MYVVLAKLVYNGEKIAKQRNHLRVFLSYTFLILGWSMKTKYLLYFQKFCLNCDLSDCMYVPIRVYNAVRVYTISINNYTVQTIIVLR